ncbi:acyl carrier protein [Amycolatopsis pigmentata]|uniref:Carrier domain-containing protein n=1 Tax=Amycolatopsis pigmentata TaxID=450801 RepID=A0ABW5FKG8_9PSEU
MTAPSARGESTEALRDQLTTLVAETTGSPVRGDRLFLESLATLRLKSALHARYGVDIGVESLFDFGIDELADTLQAALLDRHFAEPEEIIEPDEAGRSLPFPLTEVQQAYWLGGGDFELGGRSAHFYLEIDFFAASAGEIGAAFDRLLVRHDMLRAVLLPDGRQQVLAGITTTPSATTITTPPTPFEPNWPIRFSTRTGGRSTKSAPRTSATASGCT